MPQFDFFFFWNCIIQFFLVFNILIIFIYSFLLPLIYKIEYAINVALPARSDYIEYTLKYFYVNCESKKFFRLNKLHKIYITL